MCNQGDLRLVDGATSTEGRVELCNDNQWGTVCDDQWANVDAGVACGQLGFATAGQSQNKHAAYSYVHVCIRSQYRVEPFYSCHHNFVSLSPRKNIIMP